MIKIENVSVSGWEQAIRGMRNPMNSWNKSDSYMGYDCNLCGIIDRERHCFPKEHSCDEFFGIEIGPNDHDLMLRLARSGPEHAKYRRMIVVYVDITAPLYWWKEFKTYRAGRRFGDKEPDVIPCDYFESDIEMNSCSTMHKIHAKEFTLEDFSCEHLMDDYSMESEITYAFYRDDTNKTDTVALTNKELLNFTCQVLNKMRMMYLETKDKRYWWQMIQTLPTSYNQRRTVMLNYEVLSSMYRQRKGHRLDEWYQFCDWLETLPYSELITLKEPDTTA